MSVGLAREVGVERAVAMVTVAGRALRSCRSDPFRLLSGVAARVVAGLAEAGPYHPRRTARRLHDNPSGRSSVGPRRSVGTSKEPPAGPPRAGWARPPRPPQRPPPRPSARVPDSPSRPLGERLSRLSGVVPLCPKDAAARVLTRPRGTSRRAPPTPPAGSHRPPLRRPQTPSPKASDRPSRPLGERLSRPSGGGPLGAPRMPPARVLREVSERASTSSADALDGVLTHPSTSLRSLLHRGLRWTVGLPAELTSRHPAEGSSRTSPGGVSGLPPGGR